MAGIRCSVCDDDQGGTRRKGLKAGKWVELGQPVTVLARAAGSSDTNAIDERHGRRARRAHCRK
eukprot:5013025-Pleurochrysis_carterae.AAC.2